MGKPFPFFFFFFFFFFFRADVSSEDGSRAGRGACTGRAWIWVQKHAESFTGAWRRVRRFLAAIFLV
jgi:hypothetical protein